MDVKAQMIVAGMFREGDPEFDPALVPNAVAELRKHFVEPELQRRTDGDRDANDVDQALIVLPPDGQSTVLLGNEADFVAVAGTSSDVVRPRDVFIGQITALWPDGIDPDAAWTGYVTTQGGRILVCDFRRDRQSVRLLLDRARQFVEAAQLALEKQLLAPAIEHLNTAAELAVIVLIRLGAEKVGRDHAKRRAWLRREAELSGLPKEFSTAVDRLGAVRNAARYGEARFELGDAAGAALRNTVRELVEYADERAR